MTLLTTREERAERLAWHGQDSIIGRLARDIDTLLAALVAEKRAHADAVVKEDFDGSEHDTCMRLRAEAEEWEKLR